MSISKFRGSYKAFLTSFFVHALLLHFVLSTPLKYQRVIEPTKPIKSYLYHKQLKKKVVGAKLIEKQKNILKKYTEKKVDEVEGLDKNVSIKKTDTSIHKSSSPINENPKVNLSAYQALNNLKNTINKGFVEQESIKYQQPRTATFMRDTQVPVPRSVIKLTEDQKRKQNTTRLSGSMSIIKHNNGSCTIIRDKFLGSPIEATISKFSCGESKYDKNFRQHMQKVIERLVPK